MEVDNIIDDVFPYLIDPKAIANTVILTPSNKTSLELNGMVIKKVPGQQKTYVSSDKVVYDEEKANNYQIEFLNSLTPSGMPPHTLNLKHGAMVMLLWNLDSYKGLCNGTRLIIHNLHEHVINAEILTGACAGDLTSIPRIQLQPLQMSTFPLHSSIHSSHYASDII